MEFIFPFFCGSFLSKSPLHISIAMPSFMEKEGEVLWLLTAEFVDNRPVE